MPRTAAVDLTTVLPLGFGLTVAMWAVAYIAHLPAVAAPGPVTAAALFATVLGGGWLIGRRTGRAAAGLAAGALASVLNMLILGSLLSSPEAVAVRPSALWWVPGSIVVVALLAAAAATAGARGVVSPAGVDGPALFAWVAVAATFLLVVAGGLVTSKEAGLAVVDWPNSFGYNMFLYPLSRMTGGVYYEHAHRLFGALVGLTTLVLAWYLWRRDGRRFVHGLVGTAAMLVILQGILGGLRVTGSFTLSTLPEDMAPSIALAVAHGVLGQLFLALLVGLAVAVSGHWREAPAAVERTTAGGDHTLQAVLVATLVVQLVLGAIQRHLAQGLIVHITLAAVVTMVAVIAGARAWGFYHGVWPVQRLGQLLIGLVSVQVALGIAALAVTQGQAVVGSPTTLEVTITTAHQAFGALLLAASVALAVWTRRLFRAEAA